MHVVHSRRGEVSNDPYEEVPDDIAVVGYMCKVCPYHSEILPQKLICELFT